eukprot:COSAG04_NODE_4568_length_2013_cov_1.983804_3_plen_85_part_00
MLGYLAVVRPWAGAEARFNTTKAALEGAAIGADGSGESALLPVDMTLVLFWFWFWFCFALDLWSLATFGSLARAFCTRPLLAGS